MPVLHDAPGTQRWITVTEENGVRYLYLDSSEEGAMTLSSPDPVFNYLWYHKCSHLVGRPIRRALVLGAGAFTAAKCLALDHPGAIIDAVDEEAELAKIGREFFFLERPEFATIHFHGMTAEHFLAGKPDPYDFVFDDLFDGFQHVPLAGRGAEHWRKLRSVVPNGICVKNLIWSQRSADSRAACAEAIAACRASFPSYGILALGDPSGGHNLLIIALSEPQGFDWLSVHARLAAAGLPSSILEQASPEDPPAEFV